MADIDIQEALYKELGIAPQSNVSAVTSAYQPSTFAVPALPEDAITITAITKSQYWTIAKNALRTFIASMLVSWQISGIEGVKSALVPAATALGSALLLSVQKLLTPDEGQAGYKPKK